MRLILDASVALKWVLPEDDSKQAIALRDEFIKGIHSFAAPDIFPVELGHGLARAERRGILQSPQGSQRLADLLTVLPELQPSLPLLPRAFEIASNARMSVYDCLHLALAEVEGCNFLTADRKLFLFPNVSPFPM